MAGLMLHLKLELVVSSCEKSDNGVVGKVAECTSSLRKNVSWICFFFFFKCYLMAAAAIGTFFGTVID